jgi:hypothetical protein
MPAFRRSLRIVLHPDTPKATRKRIAESLTPEQSRLITQFRLLKDYGLDFWQQRRQPSLWLNQMLDIGSVEIEMQNDAQDRASKRAQSGREYD